MVVNVGTAINHKQQTEMLAMESCCVCREGMKSKNWKVVRDVDVFKILAQLASSVVQWNGIKKKKQQNSPIFIATAMLLMIEI